MPVAGRFITLEGGEGAGKSTLARALADALEARGHAVDVTREPGGTENAEQIRSLLVSGEPDRWSSLSEALLLYAARVDHLDRRIRPALNSDTWVICDRFSDSTRAYQGAAGRLDRDRLNRLHQLALDGFEPDLTFILDLDPAIGMERTRQRGEDATRFEKQDLSFHAALREGFLDIAAAAPYRCAVLDATQPPQELAQAALAVIDSRLGS